MFPVSRQPLLQGGRDGGEGWGGGMRGRQQAATSCGQGGGKRGQPLLHVGGWVGGWVGNPVLRLAESWQHERQGRAGGCSPPIPLPSYVHPPSPPYLHVRPLHCLVHIKFALLVQPDAHIPDFGRLAVWHRGLAAHAQPAARRPAPHAHAPRWLLVEVH